MRAATLGERARDKIQGFYEGVAEQPLGRILDLLGLSGFGDIADSFSDPNAADELHIATGPRRVPRFTPASDRRHGELLKKFGGTGTDAPTRRQPGVHAASVEPGARIPRNTQAGQGTPDENMAKIPRFRSPLGTFIKHEGEWWRIKATPNDVANMTLELLPPGVPEPGVVPKVLQTKTLSVDDLVSGIREAKGVREPKRQVLPKKENR